MNFGGGGSQQMMSSSISMVSLCVVAVAAAVLAWQMGVFGGSTAPAPVITAPQPVVETDGTEGTPVMENMDGARLITNGNYSMRTEGTDCNNQSVLFSLADNSKWLWNLKTVGAATVDGQQNVPVYTIESFYRVQDEVCDKRFLTAPIGCKEPPYLDRYRAMDYSQRWILMRTYDGLYTIRSLLCTKSRSLNQYIIQSGSKNNSKPRFSPGSGTPFEFRLPN